MVLALASAKVPLPQRAHALPPFVAKKLPGSQGVQALCPVRLKRPAKHVWQALRPVLGPNVPAAQDKHAVGVALPSKGWYVAIGQSWKAVFPRPAQYAPAGHAEHELEPMPGWYEPELQGLHARDAVPFAKVPAAQATQPVFCPSPWNFPAEQALHTVAPLSALAVPGAHGTQAVCAVLDCEVPAAHSVHELLPTTGAMEPALQAVHCELLVPPA